MSQPKLEYRNFLLNNKELFKKISDASNANKSLKLSNDELGKLKQFYIEVVNFSAYITQNDY